MPPTYPHMRTKGDFPDVDGVNVYKYDNQLDYKRFDYSQMEICVCRVPWDMGEAHVGQRTISGIGNVVYFEDKTTRNAWFDAIPDTECFRWETKYRELHRDMRINVPLPFDIAARYNYVYVRYHLFANDDSTLEYENDTGVREWFYFVREVNFIAPNTTELVLMDDAWQTWIYDVDVTGMVLERGHAPMFATKADEYLENPIENNDGLLTEDVNYGELQKVSDISAVSLNEKNMYACIAMSCNPWSEWGKKAGDWNDDNWEDSDWRVASSAGHITTSHVPAFRVIGIPYDDFNAFCDDVYEQAPQFKQTWQGVFFVSADYLTFGNHGVDTLPEDGHFELFGHTVWILSGIRKTTFDLTTLTKEKFGYPAEYADVAKLYTFPYAAIELTDEKGESTLVKVEETTGKLDLTVAANMVFPYINLRGTIGGIGGAKSAKVNFVNLVSQNVTVEGRWYDHIREWEIPCFAVMISAAKVNDYAQHYDRVQKRVEYENGYQTAKNDARERYYNAYDLNDAWKNSVDEENELQFGNVNGNYGNEKRSAAADKANADRTADANKDVVQQQIDSEKSLNYKAPGVDGFATGINIDYATDVTRYDNSYLRKQSGSMPDSWSWSTAPDYSDSANGYANIKLLRDTIQDNAFSSISTAIESGQLAASANLNGISSMVNGVSHGAVGGLVMGGIPGAVGGGVLGGLDGIVSACVANSSASIVIGANTQTLSISNTIAQGKAENTFKYNVAMTSATTQYNNDKTDAAKTRIDKASKRQVAIMEETRDKFYGDTGYVKQNASATQTARNTNADGTKKVRNSYNLNTSNKKKETYRRSYNYAYGDADGMDNVSNNVSNTLHNGAQDKSNAYIARNTAENAIRNSIKTARMEPASIFGTFDNDETATTAPMAMFANIVTESDAAIANAGDQFLRYGYEYERQWKFDGNWNIGAHFTYWKLSDFWVRGLQVPDLYMDKLRFFLYGGVTVWRKPEDIGNISIYENWN